MRISDWSSDVCSSDLWRTPGDATRPARLRHQDDRTRPCRRTGRKGGDSVQAGGAGVRGGRRSHGGSGMTVLNGRKIFVVEDEPLILMALEDMLEDMGCALAGSASNLALRSEEHTSELQSLMRISYAVFCLK